MGAHEPLVNVCASRACVVRGTDPELLAQVGVAGCQGAAPLVLPDGWLGGFGAQPGARGLTRSRRRRQAGSPRPRGPCGLCCGDT